MSVLKSFLSSGAFIPHGHCYLWKTPLVLLNVISDALITLAYFSIPFLLVYIVRKRGDLPFNSIFFLFGSFIVACGTGHLLDIWTLWYPTYWVSTTVKVCTAVVSLVTALVLVSLVPQILRIPSNAQLEEANRKLATEIVERQQAEQQLQQLTQELEKRVEQRTLELTQTLEALQQSQTSLRQANEELEKRVEQRTAELKAAKVAADTANQAKSEFLANMSHELRTPLNGVLGYAQILMRDKNATPKQRHGISVIYQCGSHLLTLINDVLDLSKIEARKLELCPKPIHFPSFLQGVVEILRIRAEQKGIDFIYQTNPELPEGIQVDEKRLRQVLINLLGNAIKFTEAGTVTFKVSTTIEAMIAKVWFQVEDTGVGIPSEELQKIFIPFEQVGERCYRAEGTGLGLAISSQIVSLMGSQIQVRSQLGVGSVFSFEVNLPLIKNWMQITASSGKAIRGYDGKQKRILVIDDRQENRSVLVNLLEPLGFEIVEAENGQEGFAKATQIQPDLIITDILMPVMDGHELLRQLRHSEKLKHLPVLVSSASVSEIDRQKSLEMGGDDFLAKPIQVEELLQLLEKQLDLVWQYEQPTSALIPSEQALEDQVGQPPSENVFPPSEDLAILLNLARQGRLKKLTEVAEQVEQTHPTTARFIQQILKLAKQFQAKEIEKLIESSLHFEA